MEAKTLKRRKPSIIAAIRRLLGGQECSESQFDEFNKRKERGKKIDWYKNR